MAEAIPPQNIDAERSVLGAMLASNEAIEQIVSTGLDAGDFYRPQHGTIYRLAVQLFERGEPVDVLTINDELSRNGGGTVNDFAAGATPDSAAHHATIVREQALARRLVVAGQNIARLGYERPAELEELIGMAEGELTQAVESASLKQAVPLVDGITELVDEIREAYASDVPITGKLTGLKALDNILNGFWDGQLIILAARPGNGKSALALNIAENFADNGIHSYFVSLEMSRKELQYRSLSRAGKINGLRLQRGAGITGDEARRFGEIAIPTVKQRAPFVHVQDSGGSTLPTLRAETHRLVRQQNVGLVVVDYLQLMHGHGDNRTEQISGITRGLKLLARDLDLPILALSQMNREIERRNDKRPTLADLRESGSLEQDGDVVMFIHDDSNYDPDREADGTVELIIAKNRKGPRDTAKVTYNRAWNSFKDLGGS